MATALPLVGALLTLATAVAAEPVAPEALRPNIVYILADDLGYGDLGCYGQEKVPTPNLDRLAAEGMRFTQHYAGSTVCAPSRSCLMTGQHTGHTRVRGNAAVSLAEEDVTIAELLKPAGYATACIGKWGLNQEKDETSGLPDVQGFDHFFGYLYHGDAHFFYPPYLHRNRERVDLPENDRERRTGRFSHDLLTDEALTWVDAQRGRPFLLYLAYTIPHVQLAAPAEAVAEFSGRWPETPVSDKHYGECAEPRATRAAMITRLDRDVGRLLDRLRQLGLDGRTLVMFASDNGPENKVGADPAFFASAGGLRGLKRDLYEGGIRVPFLARWPGRIAAGAVSDHVSAFWDLMPTLADIVGVQTPGGIDGISFAPTLLGGDGQRQHEYLYWEFFEQGGKQAVRMGDWKGVRLGCSERPDAPIEVYDLATDRGERTDVAAANPAITARLTALMDGARTPSTLRPQYWNFHTPAPAAP